LRQAANLMRGRLIGCLPVIENGRVVGIATATDVLDELGRGSSRPAVRAKRQDMRLPPAGARAAKAKREAAPKRKRQAVKRTKRGRKGPGEPGAELVHGAVAITGRITHTRGRERVRQPDSRERAPLAARVARTDKRTAGRTTAAETPAHIRSVGSELDAADKTYVRRKLGRNLGKFAPGIERTSVRVEDVNGPRGGVDKRCRIKVVLTGLPSVVVEQRHHSLQAALDGAMARAERAVRQATQRRSMKRLKPRKGVRPMATRA
jgi:CBS domain-containing protein